MLDVVDRMQAPEDSNILAARASFLAVAAALLAVVASAVGVAGRAPAWRIPAWVAGVAAPAVIATSQLAILLKGTPHYLFGLGGDQSFRVPYLTRFVDETSRADVFYSDALSFYPPLWFWIGGRYAASAGLEGWEAYKPFSLITMSVAAAVAFVLWRWLVGAPVAALLAVATAAVGNELNAYEPYSWAVVALVPPLAAWSSVTLARLNSPDTTRIALPRLAWALVPAVLIGVALGLLSFTYTLIAALACLVVAATAIVVCTIYTRSGRAALVSLAWLAVTGLTTFLVALIFWAPYLSALVTGVPHDPSVAPRYIPEASTLVHLPFAEPSAFGVASLLGLAAVGLACGVAWRRARLGTTLTEEASGRGQALLASLLAQLAVVVVATLWFAASLARSLDDTSLLPFRVIPVITLGFVAAGILALGVLLDRRDESLLGANPIPLQPVALLVAGFLLIGMAQSVSHENSEYAGVARGASTEPALLGVVDQAIGDAGLERPVVLSASTAIFAYRDLFAFQAPVEAYATPFSRYAERNEEIRGFAASRTPDELIAALDASEFEPPRVFVLRRGETGFEYGLTENRMPSQPDNEHSTVVFSPDAFADDTRFRYYPAGDVDVIVRLDTDG